MSNTFGRFDKHKELHMPTATPIKTVTTFVEAMNRGDTAAALAHYEQKAVFVASPGVVVVGTPAIQEAITEMLSMSPRLTTLTQEVFASDDLALYHSEWSMNGADPDGKPITLVGRSSDVLRKQPSGEWKIAIDNPWGTAVLNGQAVGVL
jgi:ketosteroid isomerase-like protein